MSERVAAGTPAATKASLSAPKWETVARRTSWAGSEPTGSTKAGRQPTALAAFEQGMHQPARGQGPLAPPPDREGEDHRPGALSPAQHLQVDRGEDAVPAGRAEGGEPGAAAEVAPFLAVQEKHPYAVLPGGTGEVRHGGENGGAARGVVLRAGAPRHRVVVSREHDLVARRPGKDAGQAAEGHPAGSRDLRDPGESGLEHRLAQQGERRGVGGGAWRPGAVPGEGGDEGSGVGRRRRASAAITAPEAPAAPEVKMATSAKSRKLRMGRGPYPNRGANRPLRDTFMGDRRVRRTAG